ncbi:hypothetical protein BHE74_00012311 [Ensete ventricosum]|nr:hypothetical protein BHE74_00012311 [Ensete ventricosum]
MKARCSNLVVETWVCTKDPLTVEYVRGALHPSLTKQLYGAPSKELIVRAAKSIVWAKYPDLSVEEDPIADPPEDANVLMESNQPFDDNSGDVEGRDSVFSKSVILLTHAFVIHPQGIIVITIFFFPRPKGDLGVVFALEYFFSTSAWAYALCAEELSPPRRLVMAFIGIMTIIVVKAIVLPRCHSSGLVFIGLGALRSPFSQIWRKISAQVELRGIDDGLGSDGSDLSTHFLKSPEGWPQDD